MKELSDAQARRFAEVDGVDRYALVALDPENEDEIVAVVRYDRSESPDGNAEYAAVVEDRMQGLGLGLGLTRALIEAARDRGVEKLHALVLPYNIPMLKLLRSLDLPETVMWQDGAERVDIELSPTSRNQN
jgi:RimJ/RimL family protein N-acetyltransferase